jgi:uncharacterized protein YggE
MNQTTKNVLGWAVVAAVLSIGYAGLSFVKSYGESIQPSSFRSFSVTGEGKAIAIPDVAEFTFTVVTQGGTDVASVQSKNTTAANQAIAFVKSEGVADKDIQTQYYNVSPNYETYNCNVVVPQAYAETSGAAGGAVLAPVIPVVRPCPPSSIVGYTVTQSVDVKIRDFTKIGDIMGGVVANGANQVGQLSFTLDDPTTVQNQAEADAIAKAKTEAQAIAQAGGFSLGRLLNVQTGGAPYPVMYAAAAPAMASVNAKAAPAPAIQVGSQEVDMTVTLQYEIQ